MIMSTAALVGVSKCEHAFSIHGFCTRASPSEHGECWRHVKVTRQAFCGRFYTGTIIVSVTDIIFVVRNSFKDINYDIVMYTKNAAQTTMDTKARNPGRDQKTRGCALGCWQGSSGTLRDSQDDSSSRLGWGALWSSDVPEWQRARSGSAKKTQQAADGHLGLSKVAIDLGTSHF